MKKLAPLSVNEQNLILRIKQRVYVDSDEEIMSWIREFKLKVESPSEEGKDTAIKINDPLPFVMGNLHSHVDRILRDKGMMHKDISEAIMSYTSDPFLNDYLSKLQELEKGENQDEL